MGDLDEPTNGELMRNQQRMHDDITEIKVDLKRLAPIIDRHEARLESILGSSDGKEPGRLPAVEKDIKGMQAQIFGGVVAFAGACAAFIWSIWPNKPGA